MPEQPISNQVFGPRGWTESMSLDDIGLLIRLGLVEHTLTIIRGRNRRREFTVPVKGSKYVVNVEDGTDPALTERVVG